MTDRLDCPECGGEGEIRVARGLRLACQFCHGLGYVGDDNEPAERGVSEDDDRELPPWWEEPGMDSLPVCRRCFGTGRVASLGGNLRGGTASTLVEAPCPACS